MRGYSAEIFEVDSFIGSEDNSVAFFINCCGYLKSGGFDVSLKRQRKDYYLIYIINGKGYYKFHDRYVSVQAGNIIIYRPEEMQDYFYSKDDKTELYWIHFTGSEVSNLLSRLGFSGSNIFKAGIDSMCINIFENIIQEIQIKKPSYHELSIGYLQEMLSLFSRKNIFIEKGEGAFKSKAIEKVIRCMNTEYQQEHSISYYAKEANLSMYYFIRSFKSVTKTSPAKYLEKIRISKAKELLTDTALSVSEISNFVGYTDPFYFSKVFKRVTSYTPSHYRKAFSI